MLNQVADGVWVRQSEWVWSNAIVVRGEGGLILVDPGIDGSDLSQLADDLDRLGIPVVAGFSTHPHWDHLLWHPRFGDVPRYATHAGAHAASEARERAQRMAAESASGIPLELIGLLTPLPADGGPVPGEILEHQAHAIGHAAVLLADRGVLLAGDILSDVLIPLLDPRRPDQVGAYETALDRLGKAASHIDVLVPATGPLPRVPRWRLAWPPIMPTSTRCGEERNRSTRVWLKTGSPAPTSRTWSRPGTRPDELRRHRAPGRHPLLARTAAGNEPSVTRAPTFTAAPPAWRGEPPSGSRSGAHATVANR
ncbi:MAG TPA: MBL fold metallo-hydrolase, partial [Gemmatimonadales bacterium]|nr:MBL fold metallo-hydrolase [Gemmatimonadales bacterium]